MPTIGNVICLMFLNTCEIGRIPCIEEPKVSLSDLKNLLRRDPQLTALRNSLGDEQTPVFYSSMADNVSGLHDPITGAIFLSPAVEQQSTDVQRALLARELGRAHVPQRTTRWRIGAAALLLCFALDIALMQAPLPLIPRLLDAVVATTCFWLAVWQFRTLYQADTVKQANQYADTWARTQVADYDDLMAQVLARQSIARYVRRTR